MSIVEPGRQLSGLEQLRHVMDSGRQPPIGVVHGGYATTLLDSACGCAVHSALSSTQTYTTLDLKVAYHRALTAETGPVRAEGKVISLGRRVAFAEAAITDAKGIDKYMTSDESRGRSSHESISPA